jgi:hypothetical protein
MSSKLKDLEKELMGADSYDTHVEEKIDRKLLTTNALESTSQAKLSKMGGNVLTDKVPESGGFSAQFKANVLKLLAPISITMLVATFTYPVAVRIVRARPLRLRGFYPIHITIAPFLAWINVNVFGATHGYFRIKAMEQDYIAVED